MDSLPLASSMISGGVFVMGLVVSGTLSDYRDAERAPTDVEASLYTILRGAESMEKVWGRPNMADLRGRLIAIVTALDTTSVTAVHACAKRPSRSSTSHSLSSKNQTSRPTTWSECGLSGLRCSSRR
ncbi:hypothetical protein [Timonella senegalensis]|uniref:hypothetical protein n=1 Tax=Timonella senegalensis TaxID=1465825 RepID=UPI0028B0F8AE|nr:hypothetical protein [Timonella senegalensis]